jgi:hypothetical protein
MKSYGMYYGVKDRSDFAGTALGLFKIDSDRVLFKALFVVVLLSAVWPLALSGICNLRPTCPHWAIDA